MPVRFAIIEDNPFALKLLQQMILRLRPDWEMVFSTHSVKATVEYLNGTPQIALIFMDIELSDGKCFSIFEQTGCTTPIIFTTAYNEYAINAFKVNGTDYLLKPVEEKDLAHAIDKYEFLHSSKDRGHLNGETDVDTQIPHNSAVTRLLTVSGDRYGSINISDVAWFASEDNYAIAYMSHGGKKLTNINNLSVLETLLPADRFFRLSRAVIASIDSVVSVSKHLKGRLLVGLKAAGESLEVTVAAGRRDDFLHWFGR